MKGKTRSPAMELIHHFMRHQGEIFRNSNSSERWGKAIRSIAYLAVEFGLRWEPDDLKHLAQHNDKYTRQGYAGHPDGLAWSPDEYFYTLACGRRETGGHCRARVNRSACIAYETLRGRKPWVIKSVGNVGGRRLCVGDRLTDFLAADGTLAFGQSRHYGDVPVVTSFDDTQDIVRACTYPSKEELEAERQQKIAEDCAGVLLGEGDRNTRRRQRNPNAPKRILTITREMLKTHNAAIVKAAEARKAEEEDERMGRAAARRAG